MNQKLKTFGGGFIVGAIVAGLTVYFTGQRYEMRMWNDIAVKMNTRTGETWMFVQGYWVRIPTK